MKLLPAKFIDNPKLVFVRLSKELKVEDGGTVEMNIEVLDKYLTKAREKFPETVGIVYSKGYQLRLEAPNEKGEGVFYGNVWASRARLKGKYTVS